MAYLQKTPFVSSGILRTFSGIPQWLNKWGNPWVLNLGAGVGYGVSENDNVTYIQYGENAIGWASIRYLAFHITVNKETLNADNSIDTEITVTPLFWESTQGPSRDRGYAVNYHIIVNGQTVWTHSGLTTDAISRPKGTPIKIVTTIPPESHFTGSMLELSVQYPNGEAPSTKSKIGYSIYNPNPKYKPWGLRRGTWKSLTAGFFKKRTSGQWKDQGQIVQNKIRKSNTWQNQGKIGD